MGADRSRGWRARLKVYGVELVVGLALASGFFLVLLWALHRFVPESTELGSFAARPRASVREPARLPGAEPKRAPGEIAVLSAVKGDVQDRPADSIAWFVAKTGRRLGNGHAVQSYANASARVDFDDRNVIELGEKTVVVVRTPERASASAPRVATVLFMEGFLRARIDPRAGGATAVAIEAGGGSVRPASAGGDAEIALKLDRDRSTLAVLDGAAEVRWKDRVTKVPAGMMVSFDPAHAPGAPVPVPSTPTPVAPREGESFSFRASPPQVELTWEPAGDADEYRVQIASDPEFSRVVYSGRVRQPRLVHGSLGAGSYAWRVAGMRDGIEGRPSAGTPFEVVQEQKAPELSVAFPAGAVTDPSLILRGTTDPGCQVFVNEVRAATDAAGRFEQALTLRPGYNFIVVQAVDPLGNTSFRNHTVVARLAPAEESR